MAIEGALGVQGLVITWRLTGGRQCTECALLGRIYEVVAVDYCYASLPSTDYSHFAKRRHG